MLKRDRLIRMQVHQLADAVLLIVSFWLACQLRLFPGVTELFNLGALPLSGFAGCKWLYFVLPFLGPPLFESQGVYDQVLWGSRRRLVWSLTKACGSTALALVLVAYCFQQEIVIPRGVLIFFGFISFLILWLKYEIIWSTLRLRLAREQTKRRVLLVGAEAEFARIRRELTDHAPGSFEVVGTLNLTDSHTQRLIDLLHEHAVSAVFISARHAYFDRVENVIKVCELEGVDAFLEMNFFANQIARAGFDELSGRPVIAFRSTPETSWQMVVKHLIDFLGALFILLCISPVLLVIAILIRLDSPGPILFRQQRSGLNGRPFVIFKFRTMVTNAEQFKHELQAMNEMSGPVFKITHDPRITRLGKILRKYSLDEFPQLLNVLRGEMSLVGPRPLPVDEVKRFNDLAHRRRLSVKPGLTCIWQVNGRNQVSDFNDWVRMDLEYIDNWSLWLDLSILLRTIPAVLLGTGAK